MDFGQYASDLQDSDEPIKLDLPEALPLFD
jgi:hypothetical protein